MRTKEDDILEDNLSNAIYDNIEGGYGGSIEGYSKATEKCLEIAIEYAKEVTIEFNKWANLDYHYMMDATASDGSGVWMPRNFKTQSTSEIKSTEQLFNQFIQSIK